jgi:hypothetical protein
MLLPARSALRSANRAGRTASPALGQASAGSPPGGPRYRRAVPARIRAAVPVRARRRIVSPATGFWAFVEDQDALDKFSG